MHNDRMLQTTFGLATRRSAARLRPVGTLLTLGLVVLGASAALSAQDAQTPPAPGSQAPSAQSPQSPARVAPTTVTVTAQKEPADAQKLPISITAVTKDALSSAGVDVVGDAARYAPNTYFTEFTARKLSNARFRGVGSSPANPGVTTFIDGVPQLNTNSSSIDFMDVRQVEFVRGPQSALFGRNALGGLVNIESTRPSLDRWTGGMTVPFGNQGAWDLRGNVSGPLGKTLGVGVALGHGERDGFTRNTVTNTLVDSRSATAGKGQFLWAPNPKFDARLIVSGERSRDGDYALNDLAALRSTPFRTARDFAGRTERDVLSTTLLARHEGARFTLSTTTGIVRWETFDVTDLDYSASPLLRRSNLERDAQFTQEVRLASPASSTLTLPFGQTTFKWQAGAFFFSQNYDQNAVNSFAPFVLSTSIAFPVDQTAPLAELDDTGIGLYGQGTITVSDRLDLTAGLRFDRENKTADLRTFYAPVIAAPVTVAAERSFNDVSPTFAAAFRVRPDRTVYASVGRGFKAGGFNPISPAGSESYGQERTWNVETGVKATLADGKATANAAIFFIDWNGLQLNLPNTASPGQFYIANVGGARSAGLELEGSARPREDVEVFGSFGFTRATFSAGSVSGGVNVSDNKLPNTPDFTSTLGIQVTRPFGPLSLYGRGEMVFYGAFQYDDMNTQQQGAYSLGDIRVGARHRYAFAEVWVRNAFDTRYIPVAFAYGSLAPSGFVGEMGKPRTFGVRAGITF
jgi:iron complex outermembrane recepter protein